MNIQLTGDAGMTPKPEFREWMEARPYLSVKQRGVYLYIRYHAVKGWPLDLKKMGRDLSDRKMWESPGAMTIAAIRAVMEQLEGLGLVTFEDDTERVKVLGTTNWERC